MKPILWVAMGFALGAAAGYGVSVMVSKKMKCVPSAAPVDDAVDSEDEFARRREEFLARKAAESDGDRQVAYVAAPPAMATALRTKKSAYVPETLARTPANEYERAKVNYTAFSKAVDAAPEALDGIDDDDLLAPVDPLPPIGDDEIGEDGQEPIRKVPPVVITGTQYDEEMPHYAKEALFYYAADDTVANQDEEILPRPEDFLGDEALDKLGPTNTCVYVRNDALGIDYEIVFVPGSYQEQIDAGTSPTTKAAAAAYHTPKK